MNSPIEWQRMARHQGSDTHDVDPEETREWEEAFEALLAVHGKDRARYILECLSQHAEKAGLPGPMAVQRSYVNTIAVDDQPTFPGDLRTEQHLAALMRWNALAMVV